jgi:tetratricopeptide (TPR) repeat protein
MGSIHDKMGNESAAIRYYKKAVELDEYDTENWLTLGDAYYRYDKFDKAKDAFRKACEVEPLHPDVWLDYSAMFAEEEDFSNAITIMIKGIEHQPQNAEFYYRLAGYLMMKGREKEAILNFEIAVQINYDDYYLLFDFYPELADNARFNELLNIYKPLK